MYQPSNLSPILLTKALFRAVEQLQLSAERVLRLSADEVAKLQSGTRLLDPQRPEWDTALKIVGMFRTIVEVLGTVERAKAWLGNQNQALNARPIDLLGTADADLVHRYLKAVSKNELRMPPPHRREH